MAQHVHKFAPVASVPFTAGAAVTAGQLLVVSDDREVSPAGANATAWIGTAAFDAAAGESVTVLMDGVQLLLASADITAGSLVVAAADGKIAALAAVTTPTANDVTHTRGIVGVALTSVDVSEVSDDRIEVKLAR